MSLHPATLAVLILIAVRRLSCLTTFTAWKIEHAWELIGGVQQLAVAVVPMHRASFQG